MTRLLMPDFVLSGHSHGGHMFPYVWGFMRQRGLPARWLRLDVEPDAARTADGGVDLDAADRERLPTARWLAPSTSR